MPSPRGFFACPLAFFHGFPLSAILRGLRTGAKDFPDYEMSSGQAYLFSLWRYVMDNLSVHENSFDMKKFKSKK